MSHPVPSYSQKLVDLFAIYVRGYFRRHFTAVRTSAAGTRLADVEGPLVVYSNHPSWWDPIHFLLLGHLDAPRRRIYGPMDAAALEKYKLFKRMGVFGIERETRRGAAAFLKTSRAILATPGASLWLTAQGRFTDPRQRPVRLMQGIGHLARTSSDAVFVPLAIEYPFWNERQPEALSRFGHPIRVTDSRPQAVDEWTRRFAFSLAETQDALAADARSRDPERFRTLLAGRVGVGGIYDIWRRARAATQGRRFRPAHGDLEP